MRALGLVALVLLAPGAAAWSATIEAPVAAGEGLPFLIAMCADGEVRLLAENASLDIREDRYQPAGCRDVLVTPEKGVVRFEARVRSGSAIKARAFANVTLLDVPFVASEIARVGDLRVPLANGLALLPLLPGVAGAPAELRIVEARAPPFEGIILANEGPGAAHLAVYALDGIALPNGTLPAGEQVFLGRGEPPDVGRHIEMSLRVRNGTMHLTAATRAVAEISVPKLKPGESTLGRYGRTNLSSRFEPIEGEITAYATPGATPLPAFIDEARAEVLVESHTLTSPDVAAALARALDRGAQVRVLLEGAPPGGVPADERALGAALQARGARVLTMGGEGARYRTMHAKLVVVDRAAVAVATENLNEGRSRGFGLIVRNATLAATIAGVMDIDAAAWHDIHDAVFGVDPAELVARAGREPTDTAHFSGSRNVSLVLSPDDPAASASAAASARRSLDVAMLRAESDGPMIAALVEAARHGAHVRLLLDSAVEDGTNRETAARLNAIAAREGLALEVKLDTPARVLHAKTFIVDGNVSYVGSMNWVRAAWEDNREAGLLVEDASLAAWLTQELEESWDGEKKEEARAEVPAPSMAWIVLLVWLSRRSLLPRRGRGEGRT